MMTEQGSDAPKGSAMPKLPKIQIGRSATPSGIVRANLCPALQGPASGDRVAFSMRASNWEFRDRAMIFGLIIAWSFALYSWDHFSAIQVLVNWLGPKISMNPDALAHSVFCACSSARAGCSAAHMGVSLSARRSGLRFRSKNRNPGCRRAIPPRAQSALPWQHHDGHCHGQHDEPQRRCCCKHTDVAVLLSLDQ